MRQRKGSLRPRRSRASSAAARPAGVSSGTRCGHHAPPQRRQSSRTAARPAGGRQCRCCRSAPTPAPTTRPDRPSPAAASHRPQMGRCCRWPRQKRGSHESCVINPNRLGQLHALQRRAARQGLHSDLLHAVAGDEAQRLAGEKCQTAERFHSGGQSHFAQGGIGIMERSVIIFLSVERPCRQTADIVRGKVEIVVHPSVHIHFRPVGHAGQVDLFHAGVVERDNASSSAKT